MIHLFIGFAGTTFFVGVVKGEQYRSKDRKSGYLNEPGTWGQYIAKIAIGNLVVGPLVVFRTHRRYCFIRTGYGLGNRRTDRGCYRSH